MDQLLIRTGEKLKSMSLMKEGETSENKSSEVRTAEREAIKCKQQAATQKLRKFRVICAVQVSSSVSATLPNLIMARHMVYVIL